MVNELWCRSCEKFASTEGLTQITQWRGGGKGAALFIGPGISHEFLSQTESEKMRPQPEAEAVTHTQPVSTVQGPEKVVDVEPVQVEQTEDWFQEFQPKPDEWYEAALDSVLVQSNYLFAVFGNAERIVIRADTIKNKPHHHNCSYVLEPGDPILVRVEKNTDAKPEWKSLEVDLQRAYTVPAEESAMVVWWKVNHGICQRQCGCWAFVACRSPYLYGTGDEVVISEWRPSTNEKHPGVVATKIRPRKPYKPLESNDDIVRA